MKSRFEVEVVVRDEAGVEQIDRTIPVTAETATGAVKEAQSELSNGDRIRVVQIKLENKVFVAKTSFVLEDIVHCAPKEESNDE